MKLSWLFLKRCLIMTHLLNNVKSVCLQFNQAGYSNTIAETSRDPRDPSNLDGTYLILGKFVHDISVCPQAVLAPFPTLWSPANTFFHNF